MSLPPHIIDEEKKRKQKQEEQRPQPQIEKPHDPDPPAIKPDNATYSKKQVAVIL